MPLTSDEQAALMARNAPPPVPQNPPAQAPLPPLPQAPVNAGPVGAAPGNAAPGNRPVRQGQPRPQFGALRGQRVPGQPPQGQANPPPAQANPPPAQANPPLAQANPPPAQANPPPAQANPPPAQANPPPAQANPPPVQANPPPAQANPPPAQANPPPVTPRPVIPQGDQLPQNRVGQLSAKQMDKLPRGQREWSDNVLKALKLKSKGSQARLLAGALSTTAQFERPGANPVDAAQARKLLKVVQAAGDPPWKDTTKAMAAADAAMHLDLLSIPAANRQLQPLGGGANQGVNTAFFVNRVDADGSTRPAFVCKSASDPRAYFTEGEKVSGIPNGGEVIREAMVGRAAQTFAAQTGIDVAMPETHVVRLSPDLVPGKLPTDPEVICSIQEFGPGVSELRGQPRQVWDAIPAASVAALAVFDLMTLNVDRHSGNVMTDGQGSMMPIDNGASFPQGGAALTRVGEAMASSYNVLLTMPSAYDPMPPAMLKSLKAMKSSDYRKALENDRDQVVSMHPEMGHERVGNAITATPMVSDEALDQAGKAARFAKLAARATPPLSPGAMQVTFGSYARELMEAADFETTATMVIAKAAAAQDVIKDVMLSGGPEFAELGREVKALGWRANERGGAASENRTVTDPLMMLSIISNNINKGGNEAAARDGAFQTMPTPDGLRNALLAFRKRLIGRYIALMPQAAQAAQTAALTALTGTAGQQMAASTPLMDTCRTAALAHQNGALNAKLANGASPTLFQVVDAQAAFQKGDPIAMGALISQIP